MDEDSLNSLPPERLREYRLEKEREWYLSEDGFLDFVRDCGAAPGAVYEPHGRYCQDLIRWEGEPDPDNPKNTVYKWKMTLWPRGSYKSSVFNVGQVCWLIARNPNIRILVASETAKQAQEFVRKAMEIIDSEWFKARFGVHRGKRWREGIGSFTSIQRTRHEIKEPTLQATGVGEVRTGMHWDFVLLDDVVSQANTKTPDSIEKLWFWFGETIAQLDPGCKLFVIGTLHHYADIYCKAQKDPQMRKLFDFSVYGWRYDDGTLFFPSVLTNKEVERRKASMPSRLFACFYENKPQTSEQQLFHPEYFKVIPEDDIPAHVWTYIFTDFAFIAEEKKKGQADRTVFWVVSLDCNRVAYVRDFYVGRWKPSDSVRIACDLWNRYQSINLKGLVLEESAHKELLSSLFEEVRRQTFIRPKLIVISGRSQEIKDLRIEAAEPRFREGNIYFSQKLRDQWRKWKPLIDEMTEWPFSLHDDIPDAISDIDKRDKEDRWFCPAPPPGWRRAVPETHRPSMINGRYNPEHGYPAREFTKQNQQAVGSDLWQRTVNSEGGAESPSQSIFRRQSQRPRPFGSF